jgi:PASTA domain
VYSDDVPKGDVISQTPAAKSEAEPQASVRLVVSLGRDCVKGYSVCLSNKRDYDCAGGSGDPPWVYGTIRVGAYDPYNLDADNDGRGCE